MPRMAVSIGGQLANTHNWSINYNFATDVTPDSTQCLAIANAMMASISGSATIKAALTNQDKYSSVRVSGYPALTGKATSSAESTASAVTGSGTNFPQMPQVAVVATLRTDSPGRSYRGRLYFPRPAVGGYSAGGQYTSPTALNGVIQELAQDVAVAAAAQSISAAWCVYSRTLPALTPITSVSIGGEVDTQRRRVEAKESYTNFPVT